MLTDNMVEMLKYSLQSLPRWNHFTDGCGDPECCGSYSNMEQAEDGDYVRFDDIVKIIKDLL